MSVTGEDSTGIASAGARLRNLRQRCRFSMRQLAERAGVAASYVSAVEAGKISPTIATLSKLLTVLGTDLAGFFADEASAPLGYIFRRQQMHTVVDATRCYTFILPRRPDVTLEMLDEEIFPVDAAEFETLPADIAGYVLKGELLLEIEGEDSQVLRTGDAFFIPAGRPARGRSVQSESVRLITALTPPRY